MVPRGVAWQIAISAIVIVMGSKAASAQSYPTRPIHLFTSEVGGSSDVIARIVGQAVGDRMGQPMVVENRPALLAQEAVWKAQPDGYSLLIDGNSFWDGSLFQQVPYDPVKDFIPIALAATSPNILVVHPSVPAKSVKELIDLAKAKPGQLNYAATVVGGSNYVSAELFRSMAAINAIRVTYKGAGQALAALSGGEVQYMLSTVPPVLPLIKSGRLRAIAITSAKPSAIAPDLPTVADSGLPGYGVENVIGVFAPIKTPQVIIARLNEEFVRAVRQPDTKDKLFKVGDEAVGGSPDQLATAVKSDMARISKLISDLGIQKQ